MAGKVPAETALAWRLQTLAAAHGIEMYVPATRKAALHSYRSASMGLMRDAFTAG